MKFKLVVLLLLLGLFFSLAVPVFAQLDDDPIIIEPPPPPPSSDPPPPPPSSDPAPQPSDITPTTMGAIDSGIKCLGTQPVTWLHNIGIPCGKFIPPVCTESKDELDNLIINQCGLNEALQVIVNFTQILFALTGSVAILMFVYGGFMMIIGGARGSEDITKGKDAIKAAVIGLIIILGAWLAINFTILALTGGEIGKTATIFRDQPFNESPSIAE